MNNRQFSTRMEDVVWRIAKSPPAILHSRFSTVIILCLLALLPLSCGRAPQSVVLATVGDHSITTDDFKCEIQRRHNAHRPIPDKETLLQEMDQSNHRLVHKPLGST